MTRLHIVIPTLGREPGLHQLLESIERHLPGAPVTVVLQGEGVAYRGAVGGERLILDPHGRGAARGRNLGLASLPDDAHVAFLDDDALLVSSALAELSTELVRSGMAAVAGSIVDEGGHPFFRYPSRRCRVTSFNHWRACSESAMVWRTEVLRCLGGFRECLGVGQHLGSEEGADLVVRALTAGHRIDFVPVTVIQHDAPHSLPLHERRPYGRGSGAFVWFNRRRTSAVPYAARIVGGAVAGAALATVGIRGDRAWRNERLLGIVEGVRDAHRLERDAPDPAG